MLIKAYGESAMSKTRVYEWYKRFQDGRENVEKVKKWFMNDRRLTIRDVSNDVGISIGSCHEIFSNVVGMKRMAAKFVPKLLNFE